MLTILGLRLEMQLTPRWDHSIKDRFQLTVQSVFQTTMTLSAFNPRDIQIEWFHSVLGTPGMKVLPARMMAGFVCVKPNGIGD
jgi:hypothetical protein